MNYSRAYAAIIDYLITFGVSRIFEGSEYPSPKTHGAAVGFVSCFANESQPKPGDLIRLESAPQSPWRLSWLVEINLLPNCEKEYLCKSALNGELCRWSNVGISYFHRPTLEQYPSWRWSDDQFAFNDKWLKACKRHDPFLYRPCWASFNEDGSAEVGTRSRHNFDGFYPVRKVENWKRETQKALAQIYLELVEEHKEHRAKQQAEGE